MLVSRRSKGFPARKIARIAACRIAGSETARAFACGAECDWGYFSRARAARPCTMRPNPLGPCKTGLAAHRRGEPACGRRPASIAAGHRATISVDHSRAATTGRHAGSVSTSSGAPRHAGVASRCARPPDDRVSRRYEIPLGPQGRFTHEKTRSSDCKHSRPPGQHGFPAHCFSPSTMRGGISSTSASAAKSFSSSFLLVADGTKVKLSALTSGCGCHFVNCSVY
jgi:hypothetical protein